MKAKNHKDYDDNRPERFNWSSLSNDDFVRIAQEYSSTIGRLLFINEEKEKIQNLRRRLRDIAELQDLRLDSLE